MGNLLQQVRRMGLALAVALGLTLLATVATPQVSDELAEIIGLSTALANETSGSGG